MMNYYAQGGQAHGLKALAQQLPQYGRYGDDIVAHISSDEAKMLQAMGGSGTINPATGLPEFFSFKSVTRPFQQAAAAVNPFNPGSAINKGINQIPIVGDINKAANNLGTQIFQPLEKAFVQPASRGLAQFDKAVGNTIPGGWGTVASVAGAAMGLPTPFLVGLGALNGSGVTRRGGSFNLQGALMGGAMAYGAAELGEYARGASDVAGGGAGGAGQMYTLPGEAGDILVNSQGQLLSNSGQVLNPATQAASGAINASPTLANSASYVPSQDVIAQQAFQDAEAGLNAGFGRANTTPSMFDRGLAAIKEVPGNAAEYISNVPGRVAESVSGAYDTVTNPQTYSDLGTKASNYADARFADASKTGQGVQNLLGMGEGTAKEAAALAAKTGVKPLVAAGAAAYGGMGLMALEEQRKYLEESKAANAISQAEYDAAVAEINRQRDYASDVVSKNPFSTTPSRDTSIGDTYYKRSNENDNIYKRGKENTTLYAMGGSVEDEYGMDETRGLGLGNLSNGFMNMGSTPAFATGGMPRFLSGGGDGMSDSIKASINDDQEARLADGEFVVPADVVSHLGNGSSKAGAKQLYSMMDKVRTARTGRKSQGKKINPRKYLAA